MSEVTVEQLNREPELCEESLPCPFCGKQPYIQFWHGGGPRKRLIGCQTDWCVVQPSVTGTSKAAAIRNWNHRA